MAITLVPFEAFAQTVPKGETAQELHIYQGEEDITNKTGALAATTQGQLTAKDQNGEPLDVTWTSSAIDMITVSNEEASKGAIKALPKGIGNTVELTAAAASGATARCSIKITFDAFKDWRLTMNRPKVGVETRGSFMSLPANYPPITNWFADNVRCIRSSDESVIGKDEVRFAFARVGPAYRAVIYVTPKKAGEATLTLAINNDYASWQTDYVIATAEGIKGLPGFTALEPGDTKTLSATVEPVNESVTYESSDPAVARVTENGEITAVKNGDCKITATAPVSGYTKGVRVRVIQKGLWLIDGSFADRLANDGSGNLNWEKLKYVSNVENNDFSVTDNGKQLAYFSTESGASNGTTSGRWESSNSDVVSAPSYGKLAIGANGTAKLRFLQYDSQQGGYVETEQCSIVVKDADKAADTERRVDYEPQVSERMTLELLDHRISTVPYNEWFFENQINTSLDVKDTAFRFTCSARGGDGGRPENYFETKMQPYIRVCNKDLSNTIATFDNEKLELESVIKGNPTQASFKVKKGTLDYDTEYALVFDPNFQLNEPMRKQTVFYFRTQKFVKATALRLDRETAALNVNESMTLAASFLPENADDTDLTWTSSDGNIARVDNKGQVTAVKAGTAVIKAVNANGVSAQCKVQVAAVPVAKTVVKAAGATYDSIHVTWSEAPEAAGYEVYSASSKTGNYKKSFDGKKTSFTDKKLSTGKTRYYKARAYKVVNGTKYFSEYSNVASATPKLKLVSNVKAKASYNKVKVSYSKAAGASGYVVYRSISKTGAYKRIAVVKGGTVLSYSDKKVKTGRTYSYKVKAYRVVDGKKVYSGASAAVKAKTALGTPKLRLSVKGKTVAAKWTRISGAKKYQLYRSKSKDTGFIKVRQTVRTSYKDSKVTSGTTYYYKARAYRTVDGKRVYGKCSSIVKIKVK